MIYFKKQNAAESWLHLSFYLFEFKAIDVIFKFKSSQQYNNTGNENVKKKE